MAVIPPLPGDKPQNQQIIAALAHDQRSEIAFVRTQVPESNSRPALSATLPQAQAFERELFEQHGILPEGHPWLKPLRNHPELARIETGEAAAVMPGYRFFRVEGPGIHEVAVGPVHAGIIEPGHFRFQCHGEIVLNLEIHLGYQRRGAEELLLRSAPARRLIVAESIAGDTVIGHALAYCTAIEALAGVEAPLAAQVLRGIALELERLANHVGDLGALCNDIGYLPGASWFGRLRGEFLNTLMEISGNRYGRGLLCVGGVRFGLDPAQKKKILARLERAKVDFQRTAELVFNTPSVLSRFEQTGVVTREIANDLGLVGPVARASGCDRDVRRDHPCGIYRFTHVPVATLTDGDVFARALIRQVEAERSLTFVREQLHALADSAVAVEVPRPGPEMLVTSLIEGWRGEIAHLAVTGSEGELVAYKVVDPSFHNWFGLAMAMRGNQISDFPLCNKSFNLSYAGHDL
ncbi:MAG: NADH-quinone oxidoreductase subunit C [Candidatus Binatus sp.]|uniref:hydrogenase large subunit n=1 Tax=Candidatus Binatus sp. TaxID=2811406 RepID=UPI00272525CF|nr:NADH-quinone oxidoreductase subunit C [Candidatus Binatus sp.]MDO8432310.1 NADH-quinone oxidoreductase subunit C [Candidatus Binatus sp.]